MAGQSQKNKIKEESVFLQFSKDSWYHVAIENLLNPAPEKFLQIGCFGIPRLSYVGEAVEKVLIEPKGVESDQRDA